MDDDKKLSNEESKDEKSKDSTATGKDSGSKDANKDSSKESTKDSSKDESKESTKDSNKKSPEEESSDDTDGSVTSSKKSKNTKATVKDDDTENESGEDDESTDTKATKDESDTKKSKDSKASKSSKKSNKTVDSGSNKTDTQSKKKHKSGSMKTKKAKQQDNDSKEADNENESPNGSSKSSKSGHSKKSKKSTKSSKSHKSNNTNNANNSSVTQGSQKSLKAGASNSSTKSKKSNLVKITPKDKTIKIDFSGCRIGFIGAGKMTEAITRGLVVYGKLPVSKLFVASKTFKNLDGFKTKGVNVTKRMYDIFGQCDCDIVFMAVHGNVIRSCFRNGGSRPSALAVNYIPNQKHPVYILSLIGGVSLADIRITLLDPEDPDKYIVEMHRIMLNIGVSYGMGLGLIDVEPDSKQCSPVVRDLLTKLAKIEYFPEEIMDAACAIGGNGLAFCFYFMSALADGGFKMGLNKQMSIKLAAKTLQAASQCLLESNKHPSELQDSVTSSAGPSIYGLNVLEKTDCAAGFQSAVDVAYLRIKELVETG